MSLIGGLQYDLLNNRAPVTLMSAKKKLAFRGLKEHQVNSEAAMIVLVDQVPLQSFMRMVSLLCRQMHARQ